MEDAKVDLVMRLKKTAGSQAHLGSLEREAGRQEGMLRKLSMEDSQNRVCKGHLSPLGVCGGNAGEKPLGCGCSTVF